LAVAETPPTPSALTRIGSMKLLSPRSVAATA